ncbi:MAG: flagellin FliC [Burkholderiales bacterium PBB2]|nr:MAG: flagellin FliC [Burkholderiales bacterium PBB2]
MPAIINSNIASLNAQRNVATSQSSLSISMQRLSSGMRVNSAKDDAAGLAIAERMSAQVRGMNVAVRNANDGISLAQTAEGALGKVADSLQRMRELGVQARNATNTTTDLDSIGKEFAELGKEIQRVLGGTTFNGTAILGGGAGGKDFQIGANTTTNDVVTVTTTNMTGNADITAVTSDVIDNTKTAGDLKTTIDQIDTAINTVSSERATLGAAQNRFEAVISNLMVSVENQSASRSRILDADYATETANLSRSQILQQAGTAMIAQANQMPQQVLSLLR